MMEWISVKDRLPNSGTCVLITQGSKSPVFIARFSNGIWYSENVECFVPTHWMPIPDPPTPQSSFDAWWETLTPFENDPVLRWIPETHCKMFRGQAQIIWNAAVKAAQSPDYVP